jgi:hypothetical protein
MNNMSQELAIIKGQHEVIDKNAKSVAHKDSDLYVTSFSGGKENGVMIQLSPDLGTDHIQLKKEQVKELIKILTDWL